MITHGDNTGEVQESNSVDQRMLCSEQSSRLRLSELREGCQHERVQLQGLGRSKDLGI